MKRVAFYGGTFDPVHNGHLAIAKKLVELFAFDEFYFVPAFHAPHKLEQKVSPALCRYAMLALATHHESQLKISTIELDSPEKPFTIETLARLKNYYRDSANIFFVMGADSWNEIDTWREWEKLLLLTSFVVVTRPDFEITTAHITPEIQKRFFDARGKTAEAIVKQSEQTGIFVTDAVQIDVSATKIRRAISLQNDAGWRKLVTDSVADYIEKYKLYQREPTVTDEQNNRKLLTLN